MIIIIYSIVNFAVSIQLHYIIIITDIIDLPRGEYIDQGSTLLTTQ